MAAYLGYIHSADEDAVLWLTSYGWNDDTTHTRKRSSEFPHPVAFLLPALMKILYPIESTCTYHNFCLR